MFGFVTCQSSVMPLKGLSKKLFMQVTIESGPYLRLRFMRPHTRTRTGGLAHAGVKAPASKRESRFRWYSLQTSCRTACANWRHDYKSRMQFC